MIQSPHGQKSPLLLLLLTRGAAPRQGSQPAKKKATPKIREKCGPVRPTGWSALGQEAAAMRPLWKERHRPRTPPANDEQIASHSHICFLLNSTWKECGQELATQRNPKFWILHILPIIQVTAGDFLYWRDLSALFSKSFFSDW